MTENLLDITRVVLHEHFDLGARCRCGWRGPGPHQEHLLDQLVIAIENWSTWAEEVEA